MFAVTNVVEGLRPRDAALLGTGIVAGWCLLDVAVFLGTGHPRTAVELIPGSLAFILGGGAFGRVWHRLPWLHLLLPLVAALTWVASKVGFVPHHIDASLLARAALFVCIALWAAALAVRRYSVSAFRLGLGAGLLCGILTAAFQAPTVFLGVPPRADLDVVEAAASAAVLLGSAWPRRRFWRWCLSGLAIFLIAVPVASRAARKTAHLRPDLAPPVTPASADRPNLLVIVMDTVRADRLGAYGHTRRTTPALDAFARDHATLFEQVRSTASWTLPAHASMFTGLFPSEHGADHPRGPSDARTLHIPAAIRPAQKLPPDVPLLAERLRAEGYRTAAIVANFAYLDHRFGLDRGFEHYDDRHGAFLGKYRALPQLFGYLPRAAHLVFRDAETISDLALRWLESARGERPFFLVLNYMDAHQPCMPPSPFDREFGPEQPANPRWPEIAAWPLVYDRTLRYMDSQVERLLKWLVAQKLFDGTAVIVTADHGEAFGEHGYWSHAWVLYEEVLRVPLLVKPAGGRLKARESRPMSLADIHDLVLGLARLRDPAVYKQREMAAEWYHGVANPDVQSWAQSVGRDLEIDIVTWLEENRKFSVSSDSSVKAFDLPDESTPVALTEADLARARAKAIEWWRAHPPRGRDATPLEQEEIERLRALGYAQ